MVIAVKKIDRKTIVMIVDDLCNRFNAFKTTHYHTFLNIHNSINYFPNKVFKMGIDVFENNQYLAGQEIKVFYELKEIFYSNQYIRYEITIKYQVKKKLFIDVYNINYNNDGSFSSIEKIR